jgi:hypothetical protein
MGQILHGSATTTEAVRRVIQNSQASLRELAARRCINAKTIAKWRKCTTTCDAPDDAESTASPASLRRSAPPATQMPSQKVN